MRKEDKFGYLALIIGIVSFWVLQLKTFGLFAMGFSLGLFIKSGINQINEKKKKSTDVYTKYVLKSNLSDEIKMEMLGINNIFEFKKIERTYKG